MFQGLINADFKVIQASSMNFSLVNHHCVIPFLFCPLSYIVPLCIWDFAGSGHKNLFYRNAFALKY